LLEDIDEIVVLVREKLPRSFGVDEVVEFFSGEAGKVLRCELDG
jgi:hypothetical protein